MRVFAKGLILVGVPLLVEIALVVSLAVLLVKSDEAQFRDTKARQFSAISGKMVTSAFLAPYALVTYLQFQDSRAMKLYKKEREALDKHLNEISALIPYMPEFREPNEGARNAIGQLTGIMDSLAETARTGELLNLLSRADEMRRRYEQASQNTVTLLAKYRHVGDDLTRRSQNELRDLRDWQTRILLAGFFFNLVIGLALMYYYNNNIRMRIETIRRNTERLRTGQPLLAELSGSDEIKQLDVAFHSMTDELAAASDREKALFNNASDVICVLDGRHCFTKINPACLRLWGYDPSELIFKSVTDVVAGGPELLLKDIQTAHDLRTPITFENQIKTASGKLLEVSWSVYWSESEQSLFCVVHDITDRKNAERIKKQFLSMISSDLKVPLSAISASVGHLLNDLCDGLTKMALDKLDMARKNVQRLLGLVNDLLQMTELDSGNLELNKRLCEVQELLERSVQDVEGVATKMKVTVEIKSQVQKWNADPDRIMQVIVNLLSNAIKFSPEGGVVVLSAEEKDGMVEVKVIDQGRGIPQSHKEAIFEKFKQVSAADGARKSGTGLGLPICKQIVEEHGGRIGVDSVEGRGSTFWFSVPVSEDTMLPVPQVPGTAVTRAGSRTKTRLLLGASRRRQYEVGRYSIGLHRPLGKVGLLNKGLVLIGIPTLFEIAFVAMLSLLLIQAGEEREKELHARIVAVNVGKVMSNIFIAGTLISSGPKDESTWQGINALWDDTLRIREETAQLVKDHPEEREKFDSIERAFRFHDDFFQHGKDLMADGFSTRAYLEFIGPRQKVLPAIARTIKAVQPLMDVLEKQEARSPEIQAQLRARQGQLLAAGVAVNLVIAVLLALLFSRDITRPLATLADNAERLAREDSLNPPVDGKDEIAELDGMFHATAASVLEARQKERAVFDNSQDVICTLDGDGRFTSVNPACEDLWQCKPREILSTSFFDLVFSEDSEKVRNSVLSGWDKSRNKVLEARFVRRDGTPVWVEWSLSRAEDNGPIFGVGHDINERKEVEQLKQDFLAVVSHDLRTPLTSISGVAKLMVAGAMGPIGEPVKAVLGEILRNGDRLLELINDILDIEKLEAGHMQLIIESVGLKDLVAKSIDSSAGKRGGTVDLDLSLSVESIPADRDRLQQALTNILNHAIESSGQGPVSLSVKEASGNIEIRVRDSARTLSALERTQLFERFKDLSASEAPGAERMGTGLALPIARKIVESHGGSISVLPCASTGNEFFIRLPVAAQVAVV